MARVNQHQFEQLCDEVAAEFPSLLSGITDEGQRTERALDELFVRLCAYLGLDPGQQGKPLGDSAGFRVMQTLDEHMEGDFQSSTILDERLLVHVSPIQTASK